jgi:hypothetical protein
MNARRTYVAAGPLRSRRFNFATGYSALGLRRGALIGALRPAVDGIQFSHLALQAHIDLQRVLHGRSRSGLLRTGD